MTEKTFSTTLLAMPANLDKLGEFQPAHLGKKFSPKHLWRFCLIKKNIGKLLGQFVGKWKTARKSPAGSWANGKPPENLQRARGQMENRPKISSGLVGKWKNAQKFPAGSWASGKLPENLQRACGQTENRSKIFSGFVGKWKRLQNVQMDDFCKSAIS